MHWILGHGNPTKGNAKRHGGDKRKDNSIEGYRVQTRYKLTPECTLGYKASDFISGLSSSVVESPQQKRKNLEKNPLFYCYGRPYCIVFDSIRNTVSSIQLIIRINLLS